MLNKLFSIALVEGLSTHMTIAVIVTIKETMQNFSIRLLIFFLSLSRFIKYIYFHQYQVNIRKETVKKEERSCGSWSADKNCANYSRAKATLLLRYS